MWGHGDTVKHFLWIFLNVIPHFSPDLLLYALAMSGLIIILYVKYEQVFVGIEYIIYPHQKNQKYLLLIVNSHSLH